MKPIVFTMNPEKLKIPGHGVCVYHKKYADKLPDVPGCIKVEFDQLCSTYQENDYFKDAEIVVFVGANKFFNSSTRFHPIFELLQYGLQADRYYSIDMAPYIGDIWRLWTHWSLTRLPFDGYTYSYLLESHYDAFLEGVRPENPMSLDAIGRNARGNVDILYKQYFSPPKIHIETFLPHVYEEYLLLKERLFDDNDTIIPIIKSLSDYARSVYPKRSIPQEFKIFEHPHKVVINRTDLKIDEYLAGKLIVKMNEVNAVCEVLQ